MVRLKEIVLIFEQMGLNNKFLVSFHYFNQTLVFVVFINVCKPCSSEMISVTLNKIEKRVKARKFEILELR